MKQKLNDSELSAFAGQLSMILHSGISALEGISILRDDLEAEEGKELMAGVYDRLEETGDLTEALRESGAYPEYFLKMTAVGDRSGTLEEVMASLAKYYERQDNLKKSIREAITYPVILLGMLLAVLAVLLWQVMPVFRQVFEQLGVEMTGTSSVVFTVSDVLQKVTVALLAIVAVLAVGCVLAYRTKNGKEALLAAVRRFPPVRKVGALQACSRFSNALGLTLHSGLGMEESFEIAAGLAEHSGFEEQLKKAGELMEQGNDLGEALRDSGVFSGLNARMVSIGFRTGSAETALFKISGDCQEEADNRIQAAVGALEPTMTAVLSVLTGIILVSVMLPLLSVMTNLG